MDLGSLEMMWVQTSKVQVAALIIRVKTDEITMMGNARGNQELLTSGLNQ